MKKMNITKKLLLIGFIILLLASCAKDIIVTPPDSLRGYYIGRYFVTTNASSATGAITNYINVDWTFTDYGHSCNTTVAESQDLNLCSFSGEYTVENQLIFSGTKKVGLEVCDDAYFPIEDFQVQWDRVEEGNDTLILKRFDTQNDVKYKAVLEKQPGLDD